MCVCVCVCVSLNMLNKNSLLCLGFCAGKLDGVNLGKEAFISYCRVYMILVMTNDDPK